jgi:CheY-like chemotaxis protein
MHTAEQSNPPAVAVVNTSPDTVDLLKDVLEKAGFLVVTGYTHDVRDGRLDLEMMMRVADPLVILWDLAPPYDRNWAFLQLLRTTVLKGRRLVLTTTNKAHVERLIGLDHEVYEVVGKAEDLDAVVRATKEASRARATR